MLNEKLASLTVELALEGSAQLQAGLAAIRQQLDTSSKAATVLSSAFQEKLAAAGRLVERTFSSGMQPAVQALNVALVRQVAQVKQVSEAHAAVLIRTEAARAKLEQLTTGAIVGLATAGVRASYLSDVFGISMDRLGRTIGALVAPEVEKIIKLVDSFTSWIHQLDPATKQLVATLIEASAVGLVLTRAFSPWLGLLGALVVGSGQGSETMGQLSETGKRLLETFQQLQPSLEAVAEIVTDLVNSALSVLNFLIETNTLKWVAAVGAGLLFANTAVKIIGAISAITAAVKALTAAKILSLAFEGPTGWAKIAAGAAIGAAAIAGAGMAINAFGKHADGSRKKVKALADELPKRSSGFEDLAQTYLRIASSSVNVGAALAGQLPGAGAGAALAGQVPGWSTAAAQAGGKIGKPPEEEAIDWLKEIAANTGGTKKAVEGQKPAYTK